MPRAQRGPADSRMQRAVVLLPGAAGEAALARDFTHSLHRATVAGLGVAGAPSRSRIRTPQVPVPPSIHPPAAAAAASAHAQAHVAAAPRYKRHVWSPAAGQAALDTLPKYRRQGIFTHLLINRGNVRAPPDAAVDDVRRVVLVPQGLRHIRAETGPRTARHALQQQEAPRDVARLHLAGPPRAWMDV